MTIPFLATKLYTPRVRKALVSRPRLVERLSVGLQRKVTLISAPAGFGKTTLLTEWVRQCGRPVSWLSLDLEDNSPSRFWTYFLAALRTVRPNSGEAALAALQSRQAPETKVLLASLINDLAKTADFVVLILDDLHAISESRIHEDLVYLIENLPMQVHLVFATRADPPWPLARLRARRDMNELRSQDLRFTSDETSAFLNDVMELGLSPKDVATLEQRTEGWIVGLQMAALSMQGRSDASNFVEAFCGTHRFILDYLVEEVLERQTPALQQFLLQTSVLDRLSGPLCDAVREAADSQSMLEHLDAANLFVVPLDEERRWYRYHHLFSDLLRQRLQRTQPDALPVLHLRASAWFESRGLVVAALSHALAAGDVERVTRLVTGNALAIMGYGELAGLARWLETLPEGQQSQPWLAVSHAWVLAYAGQLDKVQAQLRATAKGLPGVADRKEAQHLAAHMNAIRAYLAGLQGRMSRAAELCRRALEQLPAQDLMARGFVTSLLGSVLRWSGDLQTAARVSGEATTMRQEAGEHRISADAFCDLAALQLTQGKLHQAYTTCQDALRSVEEQARSGGSHASVAGFAHARLSAVLREWNQVDAAVYHAREGVALSEQWGWADGLVFGYAYLAAALQAAGDADGALRAIEDGKRTAASLSPWLTAQMAALEAECQLSQGNLAAAERWAQQSGLKIDDRFAYENAALYLALARVRLAQGEQRSDSTCLHQALVLLDGLLQMSESAGAMGRVIEILVARALCHHLLGDPAQALSDLERALTLAKPEGYVRTFAGAGAAMLLLHNAQLQGIADDYVRELLAVLEASPRPQPVAPARPTHVLVEPLSERELQVLRLLRSRLSSTEIAEQLILSVHTVRSHIKSVYSKLDAHSREEAVQHATDRGLL